MWGSAADPVRSHPDLKARRRQRYKSQLNLWVRKLSYKNTRSSGTSDQAMAQDKKKRSGAREERPSVEPPPYADLFVQEGKQQHKRAN